VLGKSSWQLWNAPYGLSHWWKEMSQQVQTNTEKRFQKSRQQPLNLEEYSMRDDQPTSPSVAKKPLSSRLKVHDGKASNWWQYFANQTLHSRDKKWTQVCII
jgi:hypothetical protein